MSERVSPIEKHVCNRLPMKPGAGLVRVALDVASDNFQRSGLSRRDVGLPLDRTPMPPVKRLYCLFAAHRPVLESPLNEVSVCRYGEV